MTMSWQYRALFIGQNQIRNCTFQTANVANLSSFDSPRVRQLNVFYGWLLIFSKQNHLMARKIPGKLRQLVTCVCLLLIPQVYHCREHHAKIETTKQVSKYDPTTTAKMRIIHWKRSTTHGILK